MVKNNMYRYKGLSFRFIRQSPQLALVLSISTFH